MGIADALCEPADIGVSCIPYVVSPQRLVKLTCFREPQVVAWEAITMPLLLFDLGELSSILSRSMLGESASHSVILLRE